MTEKKPAHNTRSVVSGKEKKEASKSNINRKENQRVISFKKTIELQYQQTKEINYMEEKNDLSGLNSSGFQNLNGKFNSEIFKDNKTIELLRPVIRKYFRESKTIYRQSSSYGIKHVAENHIGTYVSNGELIYAMHLEGYKIKRDTINCCFNISGPDLRLLRNANEILEILSRRTNREIFEYLRFRKQFLKYKYHFKFLLYYKFSDNTRLKNDVIKIIAKEMNESVVNIKYWFDILKGQDSTIPIEKMEQLEKLFDMYATTLTNNIENITT